MKVGECYVTDVVGGHTYARITSERGSGMFRADVVKITNRGIDIELDSPVMDWYFRTYTLIPAERYETEIEKIIWTLELVKKGEKRNGE